MGNLDKLVKLSTQGMGDPLEFNSAVMEVLKGMEVSLARRDARLLEALNDVLSRVRRLENADLTGVEETLTLIGKAVSREPESVRPLLEEFLAKRKREWVFDIQVDLATGDPKRVVAREK